MSLRIACVYSVEDYISINKPISTGYFIPFGISMIATVLKHAGHDIKSLVITNDTPLFDLLKPFIDNFRPRLFCLTAVSTQFPLISKIAEVIKNIDPTILVALGGHHASLAPDQAISCPFIDAVCLGEGERAVVELASQIESGKRPSGIHNFWFKNPLNGGIEKNPPANFHNNLDEFPFIERGLWRSWIREPDNEPAVLVGRGCPNLCTYCSNHALRKLAKGRYVRFRSPKNILAEIDELCQNPSITAIYLEVETISADIRYALELCQALEKFNEPRATPITFKINLSITSKLLQDLPLLRKLLNGFYRANIRTINIGLESGSERIRNEVLRRPKYSNKDIIKFCETAKEYDINIKFYVMIGIPDETVNDFKETIKVLRICQPTDIDLCIFYPYPGTELYEYAKREGLFNEATIGHAKERRSVHITLPNFSRRRIMLEYFMLNFKVYYGKRPAKQIIISFLEKILLSSPILKSSYRYLFHQTKIGNSVLNLSRHKILKWRNQF